MCQTATEKRVQNEAESLNDDSLPYDAVIIGAGLAGISLLAEAVKQGYKRVIILERKPYIGGLWVDLPAWQTLQNDPADFCLNGFTTKRKVWTALDVCHMMEEYVRVAGIAPFIRLQTELADQTFDKDEADGQGEKGMWTLQVNQTLEEGEGESSDRSVGYRNSSSSSSSSSDSREKNVVERTLKAKRLILCTGKHSTAYLPEIPSDGSVPMVHSSQVHDWDALKGKNVAVVGAGASALDLVINALRVNEGQAADKARTYWLLRSPKHFGGYDYADLVLLTFFQLVFGQAANGFINYVMNLLVQATFWSFGLLHWLPNHAMDLTSSQYIPGRRYLLKNAARIDRRAGVEVVKVAHGNLHLSDGSVIEGVDALLLGTGYNRPQHNPNLGLRDEGPLLGSSVIQGEKLGHLFLFGEDLLDSTGSTPLTSHLTARHFWHQAGKTGGSKGFKQWHTASAAAKQKIIVPKNKNVNHLDILLMTASAVPEVYPTVWWRFRMLGVHLYYRFMYGTRVFYGDRVLGNDLSLDEPYALKRDVASYEIGKATVLTAATAKAGREGAKEEWAGGMWDHVRMVGLNRNQSETGSESSCCSNSSLTLANDIGTAKGDLTSSNPLVLPNVGGRKGGRKVAMETEISDEESEDEVNVRSTRKRLEASNETTPRSAVAAI
ncbi:hypothetical protein VYU27_007232 [Nannochloropsis oceanica]